ncbi:TonB-dependent siderophore receptor [Aliamphritea spongicola]|uniref:TonB-dependent siderophore receptor n=1 Tax=Aliamphritea spongicola TaxID=707589 RepID=UPI00196B3F7C|nr:TonB-dependent siderophore receptor [Aliamphritea spongicola]MBN3563614.1 TonB-dependent siderophore receptor [Aliamphritea spongicola]
MNSRLNYSVLALAICSANTALAADTPDTVSQDTVVINAKALGYAETGSASANKSSRPVSDSPYSISVINQTQLQDTGAQTLQDALTYNAGVFASEFGVDSRADTAVIRGAGVSYYLDGLRTDFGHYNRARIETYMLDNIQVLKGPGSSLYGQGSLGGIVAADSKTPEGEDRTEIWLQAGNRSRAQVGIDTQGSVAGRDDLNYRLVALGRKADQQVDHVEDDRLLINPSLRWQINEDADLTVIALTQRDKSGSTLQFLPQETTIGLPESQRLPTDTFLGHPDFDKYDTETDSITLKYNQKINDTWKYSTNFRHLKGEGEYNSQYAISKQGIIDALVAQGQTNAFATALINAQFPGNNVPMLSEAIHRKLSSTVWDHQFTTNFTTGAAEHELILGVDLSRNKLEESRWNNQTELLTAIQTNDTATLATLQVDPFNPNPSLPSNVNLTKRPTNTLKQEGIYIQDSIRINQWDLNAGLRWTHYSSKFDNGTRTSDSKVSGRLGALYNFDNGVSPYVSVATAFEPTTGSDSNNNPFKAQENIQYEAGIKFQPDSSLSLHTAIYHTTEENRLERDPDNPLLGSRIQLEEVTIKGFEAELRKDWDRFSLLANYTHAKTEVTKDSTGKFLNNELAGRPKDMASVFGKYRINEALEVGLGSRYIGSSDNGLGTLRTPSVTLYDALASYDIADWQLSLNVRNLADKEFISSCSGDSACYYGERRTVLVNARYEF